MAVSKFDPLWAYVRKSDRPEIKLTFDDIQNIIGVPIDHSFLNYKKDCAGYGYQVGKISMKEKTVTFHEIIQPLEEPE